MRRAVGSLIGLMLLVGCTATPAATSATTQPQAGSSPGGSASTAPTASASTPVAPTQEVTVTLAKGRVDPNGARLPIAKGTTLVLTVTSDHEDKVHVHGYDIEIPVGAGKTVTRQILLDQVGRFEVESHEPVLTILQLVVS